MRNPDTAGLSYLQRSAGNRATTVYVSRFGSQEHKSLGDAPTGSAEYEVGGTAAPGASAYNASFRLTHGDIVALSGDYFDPRDHLRVLGMKIPNPDSLFRLAGIGSSAPGTQVGTRDEIVWTIWHIDKNDPRFAPGGKWNFLVPVFTGSGADAVKAEVDARYLKLASRNIEHFVDPRGTGSGADGPLGSSAHASYRQLHKQAIVIAWEAGVAGLPVDMAKAREAAAQHFLTDAFAAGHLRTPRMAIREHWSAIYPNFWTNLKKKIAMDMAIYINAEQTNVVTLGLNVMELYARILEKVEERVASKPPLGFDNIVALAAHDLDNEVGLNVVNDFGETWTTYGDSSLDRMQPPLAAPPTRGPAERAVSAGVFDIETAYRLGASSMYYLGDEAIFSSVKSTGTPGVAPDKFEPEKFLPRVDPSAETSTQTWQLSNVDDLWVEPIRSDDPTQTYGAYLATSLSSGELHEQLAGVADDMQKEDVVPEWKETSEGLDEMIKSGNNSPLVQSELIKQKANIDVWRNVVGVLDVKRSYLEGFLGPLMSQPLVGLRAVIDFNPSLGQAAWNTDDAAREDLTSMGAEEKAGLTLNQRADRVTALVGGTTNYVDEADGELVVDLFQTAPAGERAQLYRLVEGHAWTGDWIEGVFVSDDEIWNALSRPQLSRLRTIINGR